MGMNYPEYKTIFIPNIDTEYCDIKTKDLHCFSCEYGWFIVLGGDLTWN